MKRKTFNTKFHIKAQKGMPANVFRDLDRTHRMEEKQRRKRESYLYSVDMYESMAQTHIVNI